MSPNSIPYPPSPAPPPRQRGDASMRTSPSPRQHLFYVFCTGRELLENGVGGLGWVSSTALVA